MLKGHNAKLKHTQAMVQPTLREPRDLSLEQQEVMDISQILDEIRGWKNKVKCCVLADGHPKQPPMMATRDPAFPNGVDNEKRYPPPGNVETWTQQVVGRKQKESAYNADSARNLPKVSAFDDHTEDTMSDKPTINRQPATKGKFENVMTVMNTIRLTICKNCKNSQWDNGYGNDGVDKSVNVHIHLSSPDSHKHAGPSASDISTQSQGSEDRPRDSDDPGNHSQVLQAQRPPDQIAVTFKASGVTGCFPSGFIRAPVSFNDVPRATSHFDAGSRIETQAQVARDYGDNAFETPEDALEREPPGDTPLQPSRIPNPPRRRKRRSSSSSTPFEDDDFHQDDLDQDDEFDLDAVLPSAYESVDEQKPRARQTRNSMRAGLPPLATGRDYPKVGSRMDPGLAFFVGESTSTPREPDAAVTTFAEGGNREGSDGSRRNRRRRA